MCFYLNFANSDELRRFADNTQKVQNILTAYRLHRKANFGVVVPAGTKAYAVTIKRLFDWILHPSNFSQITPKDLHNPIEFLDESRWPKSSNNRIVISWLATINQLIKAAPEHFKDYSEQTTWTKPTLGGITPEDWHRGYQLLLWFWRFTEGHGALKDSGNTSKSQVKLPSNPGFLTDDDYLNIVTEEDAKLTQVNIGDPGDYDTSDVDDSEDDIADYNEAEDETKHRALTHALARVGGGRFDLAQVDNESERAKLPLEAQRKLCTQLGSRVTRLWPPEEVDLPYADVEPDANDEDPHKELMVASTHRADTESVINPQSPEEVRAAQLGLASKQEAERRKTFWAMQHELNLVSSQPMSYQESCEYYAFDPDKPQFIMKARPKKGASASSEEQTVITLFPWQPVGMAWLSQMEQSRLRGAMLAFDMGLGKTIVALCHILLAAPSDKDTAMPDAPPDSPTNKTDTISMSTGVNIGLAAGAEGTFFASSLEYSLTRCQL